MALALALGRRWITIDTSRVALALARTRLMAARFPYYYLAGSCPQMTQMTADEDIKNYLRQSASSADKNSSSSAEGFPSPPDIRKGFVYKRVPHVTLKSIANNPDIKEGMTRAGIDAAIRRHAETETLYDQPYEDRAETGTQLESRTSCVPVSTRPRFHKLSICGSPRRDKRCLSVSLR